MTIRTSVKIGLVLVILASLFACETLTYYEQAARGQLSILWNREDIAELLEREDLGVELRQKLATVLEIREFAEQELHLPAGENYLSYVDLGREHVVWNVFAAPEFSVDPLNWCFPIAGCVSYRGYFNEEAASKFADKLAHQGNDVYTGGVDAYSTLGWFNDPLPSSVIDRAEYQLAALIFHELSHLLAYVPGDTTFNESFATLVETEGLRRWLLTRGDDYTMVVAQRQAARQQQFVDLVIAYRDRFDALYQSERSDQSKREAKTALQEEMRQAYGELKQAWDGEGNYDNWFASSLNNAQLSTVSSYNELVPAFAAMLAAQGGDLPVFYQRISELVELSEEDRTAELARYNVSDN